MLHFLDEPEAAIAEAARMLMPGGRVVIIDFAPHGLEHLRDEHAHARLGFSHQVIADWLAKAGLVLEKTTDLFAGRRRGRKVDGDDLAGARPARRE